MKVAVLSDMHVGMGAKAQDLCPTRLIAKENQAQFDGKQKDYLNRFLAFLGTEGIKANYLLIPGDITDSAHPEEMLLASNAIESIREKLEVPEDNIVYVPGNHDLDWSLLDPRDSTKTKWKHRYMALAEPQFIFDSINKRGQANGNLLQNPYYNVWTFEDLVVLGYNSASTDKSDEPIHHGDIVLDHVDAMRKTLECMHLLEDKRIKVCLIHHHLRNYPLPTPVSYDPSIANNGECLIDLLLDYHFDLIVHGHRHHSFLDTRKDIPILCAGSFSATIELCWEGLVFNQFHLIEMTKDDSQPTARGCVYSWLNTAAGWQKSVSLEAGCIVKHRSPFGVSIKRNDDIANKLKACLIDQIKSTNVVSWKDDVLPDIPELAFITENIAELIDWCRAKMPEVAIKREGQDNIQFVKKDCQA